MFQVIQYYSTLLCPQTWALYLLHILFLYMMSFIYQPLVGDEIRVVSFDYSTGIEGPIACTIEHVRLESTKESSQHGRCKGCDYTWPELSAHHDTGILFKDGTDPCLKAEDFSPSNSEATLEDEDLLPWRYPWGDFIALSYSWRPASPDAFITVNGASLQVTRNLHDALIQLRRCQRVQQGFKLWIDAICINQTDMAERESQVTRMRDIYQSAWQVVVWTGPEADNSPLAFTALHWLARQSRRVNSFEGFYKESKAIDARPFFITWARYESPLNDAVPKALFHFFSRAYWQRMWIIQEVAAGRPETPVLCGEDCISWCDLYKASSTVILDSARLGRDILNFGQQQTRPTWSFDFAQDRLPHGRQFSSERLWKIQMTMTEMQRNQRRKEVSDWNSLAEALTLGRDASVTEEKDRVYGILGIKAVTDHIVWTHKPDYTIPLGELYTTFTSAFLAAGNLSILRLVSRCAGPGRSGQKKVKDLPPLLRRGSTTTMAKLSAAVTLWAMNTKAGPGSEPGAGILCVHDIPSWTVCWTCPPAPTIQLGGSYQADARLGPPQSIFPHGEVVVVKGVLINTITSVSASNATEADSRYPMNTDPSKSNIYGTYEATREAFWRTLVGDTTAKGETSAPDSYSWLLEPGLWQKGAAGVWTYGFGLHHFMKRNQALWLCGYTVEELIFGLNKMSSKCKRLLGDNYYGASETQLEALSWAVNAMAWRRVFGTSDGRMGMGTCAAEVGDRVAIIRGCNTPLILRECSGGWRLVGECYVHGVMHGEVSAETHELIDMTIY